MIEKKYLDFLIQHGADKTPHRSDGMLLEHLVGTYNILADWGNDKTLALAGLFHSVYGTKSFKTQTLGLQFRDDVRALIGEDTEALVYVFCCINRGELRGLASKAKLELFDRFEQIHFTISPAMLKNLMEIESANIYEQIINTPQIPEKDLLGIMFLIEKDKLQLSERAYSAWQDFYHSQTARLS